MKSEPRVSMVWRWRIVLGASWAMTVIAVVVWVVAMVRAFG